MPLRLASIEEEGLAAEEVVVVSPAFLHFCPVCNIQLNSCAQGLVHVRGKKHQRRFRNFHLRLSDTPAGHGYPLLHYSGSLASGIHCSLLPNTQPHPQSIRSDAFPLRRFILGELPRREDPGKIATPRRSSPTSPSGGRNFGAARKGAWGDSAVPPAVPRPLADPSPGVLFFSLFVFSDVWRAEERKAAVCDVAFEGARYKFGFPEFFFSLYRFRDGIAWSPGSTSGYTSPEDSSQEKATDSGSVASTVSYASEAESWRTPRIPHDPVHPRRPPTGSLGVHPRGPQNGPEPQPIYADPRDVACLYGRPTPRGAYPHYSPHTYQAVYPTSSYGLVPDLYSSPVTAQCIEDPHDPGEAYSRNSGEAYPRDTEEAYHQNGETVPTKVTSRPEDSASTNGHKRPRVHLTGMKHLKSVNAQEANKEIETLKDKEYRVDDEDKNIFTCLICDIVLNSVQQLHSHLGGGRHLLRKAHGSRSSGSQAQWTRGGREEETRQDSNEGGRLPHGILQVPVNSQYKYVCRFCSSYLNSHLQILQHVGSSKHKWLSCQREVENGMRPGKRIDWRARKTEMKHIKAMAMAHQM
ncbi:unnamed protein product [Darwinula stevensoni]|uniref:C2H2-type domain-containing protein n=1 Tax=Darwinula stevensoni TaxID=69355 RepID=A0A7R8ZZ93_9CRUS|nr:unnamed protein product [Darwinula stevensoni]CAG0878503.1 unnamed protein product [Darwinula stevensoni]